MIQSKIETMLSRAYAANLTSDIEEEVISVKAIGVAPPEADAAMHGAHDDLEQDDQADLHVQEAIEGTCASTKVQQ